jgi:hypothetical protein
VTRSYQLGGGNPLDGSMWPATSGPKFLAIAVFLALSALDLCLPNISFTVLFAVPLLLLVSRVAKIHHVWWYVALFVLATYMLYFVKYLLIYGRDPSTLWNFRLFNRTFAAVMLALLGIATQAWLYWQHERLLLTYLDQTDEDEVNATAGLVGCIGLGLLITAVDFVSPANFNLPILFAVPIYLVSWLRDRRSLWITALVLIGLTWIGYFLTPPATETGLEPYLMVNRMLVTTTLLLLAGILSWNIRRR